MFVSDLAMMDAPMMCAFAAVAVSAIYVFLRALRHHLETKKPYSEIPMAGRAHWFWGHAGELMKDDFVESFKQLGISHANEHGQTGFWVLHRRFITVASLKDARTVLSVEHERRPPLVALHYMSHFIGKKNLLFLNGKEWKFHRGAVARTFNPKFLNSSRSGMYEVSKTMVESLQNKIKASGDATELDFEPLMKMATLDIFGNIALSTDFGLCKTLKPSPLVRAFEYTLNGTMTRLRAPFRLKNLLFLPLTERNRTHNKERKLIRSFIAGLINEKRESLSEDDNDLLSHLLRAHQNMDDGLLDPEDVSDEAMSDILMTLLFAGYDTTSVTLTFALYLLAKNPHVQERLVKEVNSAKDLANTEELVYCWAVVWETLRLYPAGVRTNRVLAKDLTLSGGFVAPAGSRIHIPIYNIHHDEKYFPQPEEFRPDRWVKYDDDKGSWMERDGKDNSGDIPAGDRKAMLAFSSGGRNCVGNRFAQIEATIVLATLVKGLKFSPSPGFELKTTIRDLIHKPADGMPLKVEVRAHLEKN